MTTPTDRDLGMRLRDRARADAPSMALDPDRVLGAGRRRVRRRRWGAGLGIAVTAVAVAGVASLLSWAHPATGPVPAASDHLAAIDLRLVTSSTSGQCTAPPLTGDAPGTACDLDATTTYELGESLGHVTPASVRLGGGEPAGSAVTLTFGGTDQATLAAVTDGAVGERLAMLADGTVLVEAQLMSPIPGGSVELSAGTPATASAIVALLTGHDDPSRDAVADGVHTGYIDSLDGSTVVLRPAELLSGEDATAAAHQAGQGEPPGGFFIVDGGGSVELPVDANASVSLIDGSDSRSRAADVATLRQVFAGEPPAWFYGTAESFFASVTVADGIVTGIDEVYLP